MTLKYPSILLISHTFFTIKIYSKREYQEIIDSGVPFGNQAAYSGNGTLLCI